MYLKVCHRVAANSVTKAFTTRGTQDTLAAKTLVLAYAAAAMQHESIRSPKRDVNLARRVTRIWRRQGTIRYLGARDPARRRTPHTWTVVRRFREEFTSTPGLEIRVYGRSPFPERPFWSWRPALLGRRGAAPAASAEVRKHALGSIFERSEQRCGVRGGEASCLARVLTRIAQRHACCPSWAFDGAATRLQG